MPIDIDRLTEAELLDLNRRIVARLNFLREARTHRQMLNFSVGQRVSFHPPGYAPMRGVITKYNRKTVTVITEDGQHWNVSPDYLIKDITPDQATQTPGGNPSLPGET